MTSIVVATRNGLVVGPDGSKYRLARGRTLADARHPLAQANPGLFAPYSIELSVDEASSAAASDNLTQGEASSELLGELVDARAAADSYRAQLATIAEGLHARGLVPADVDTEREGWLADLVFAVIDGPPAEAGALPEVKPAALPRKRAARPRAGKPNDAEE